MASEAIFSATAMTQKAQEAAQSYELMLHGLTHEHNAGNIDRHALLLEKWCRDFCEGFYIRDLRYVIQVFGVLRKRLATHPSLFRPALTMLLKVCSLPLFEVKANERLRSPCVEIIKEYFFEICKFWLHGDALRNAEITRCFRCQVNGGVDPAVLKADVQRWVSDGLRVQVTDRIYLQTLLRDAGVVDFLVDVFNASADLYKADFVALWGSDIKVKATTAGPATGGETAAGYDSDDDNAAAAAAAGAAAAATTEGLGGGSLAEAESLADSSVTVSGLPDALEASKQALSDAQELTKAGTALMMELTEDSRSACAMCSRGVSIGAMQLFDVASRLNLRDAAVGKNLDLVWTVVDAYLQQAQGPAQVSASLLKELVSCEVMDFEAAVEVLLRVLVELLHDGYRLADKEVRNEIVVVMNMLATFPASFPSFMCSKAFNVLVTYSCVAEMGRRAWAFYTAPVAKLRNFASTADIDLQLKRTLWMTISDLLRSNDPDALLCLASSPMLDMLLSYVEFDSTDPARHAALEDESATLPSRIQRGGAGGSSIFTSSQTHGEAQGTLDQSMTSGFPGGADGSFLPPAAAGTAAATSSLAAGPTNLTTTFLKGLPMTQLRELQVLGMTFIAENGPRCVGELLRVGGPVRILEVLFHYSRSQILEHKSLVYAALLLLNRCLMCSEVVRRLLEIENGAQTFLYLFEHTDDDAAKALVARNLSLLCADRNEVCQQQVRARGGIAMLVRVVALYAEPRRIMVGRKAGVRTVGIDTEGVEDPEADTNGGDISVLIIAVLDCISRVTVRNRRNEAQYAKDEGIDALLLLLEVSPFLLRTQVLRVLADLLENRHLLTFVFAWRSPKSMRGATALFAHCWLDEETRLHAVRERGIVCNIWDPLSNHDWPVDDVNQRDGESLSSGSVVTNTKSVAVARLTEAVSSARVNNGAVPESVRCSVLDRDTRGIVARILYLVGSLDSFVNAVAPDFRVSFYQQTGLLKDAPQSPAYSADGHEEQEGHEELKGDDSQPLPPTPSHASQQGNSSTSAPRIVAIGDPGLTHAEKQVVATAQQYHALRAGEWWRLVAEELRDEGVKPIEADLALVESRVSASFDAAFNVQLEQMELHQQALGIQGDQEKTLIGGILAKKDGQLKAEYLKRHGSRRAPLH